jgi:hypothetical protein
MKEGKTSWDSFSYALMMGHNVYCHIVAVQRANQLMDIESAKIRPSWRMAGIEGKKEIELSDWVPLRVLYFNTFIKELFQTKTKAEAFDMIEQGLPFLRSLEGARLRGGVAQNNFGNLFDVVDNSKKQEDIDWENRDDDALRALEENEVDQ